MYRFRNCFCLRMMVLAGVLVFGTPVGILAEDVDHSMEGQISKPQSSGESNTDSFVDDSTDNTYGYYTIMGCTTVDVEDMVAQYEAQNVEYPSDVLTEGGAPDIDTFCTIVIEEADAEGVRGEVVYEQAMLETGWLQFGGDASAGQFNFSGLGTTGGGVAGNSFPDVRTGIRAQVQHLKAYASSEDLNQACVDNRFQYVARESAPYVEWLGIQENPYGGGWAAGSADCHYRLYLPILCHCDDFGLCVLPLPWLEHCAGGFGRAAPRCNRYDCLCRYLVDDSGTIRPTYSSSRFEQL